MFHTIQRFVRFNIIFICRCAFVRRQYRPTPWLCTLTLQTLYISMFIWFPSLKDKLYPVEYFREYVKLSDRGSVAVDWTINASNFMKLKRSGNKMNEKNQSNTQDLPSYIEYLQTAHFLSPPVGHKLKTAAGTFNSGPDTLVSNSKGQNWRSLVSNSESSTSTNLLLDINEDAAGMYIIIKWILRTLGSWLCSVLDNQKKVHPMKRKMLGGDEQGECTDDDEDDKGEEKEDILLKETSVNNLDPLLHQHESQRMFSDNCNISGNVSSSIPSSVDKTTEKPLNSSKSASSSDINASTVHSFASLHRSIRLNAPAPRPVFVLLFTPAPQGSNDIHTRAAVCKFTDWGFSCAVVNGRGLGGSTLTSPVLTSAGFSVDDISSVVTHIHNAIISSKSPIRGFKLVLVGLGLSGSVLMKYLASKTFAGAREKCEIACAAAVSAPGCVSQFASNSIPSHVRIMKELEGRRQVERLRRSQGKGWLRRIKGLYRYKLIPKLNQLKEWCENYCRCHLEAQMVAQLRDACIANQRILKRETDENLTLEGSAFTDTSQHKNENSMLHTRSMKKNGNDSLQETASFNFRKKSAYPTTTPIIAINKVHDVSEKKQHTPQLVQDHYHSGNNNSTSIIVGQGLTDYPSAQPSGSQSGVRAQNTSQTSFNSQIAVNNNKFNKKKHAAISLPPDSLPNPASHPRSIFKYLVQAILGSSSKSRSTKNSATLAATGDPSALNKNLKSSSGGNENFGNMMDSDWNFIEKQEKSNYVDWTRLGTATTLRAFDEAVSARTAGFTGLESYWSSISPCEERISRVRRLLTGTNFAEQNGIELTSLEDIKLPFLWLTSRNDPMNSPPTEIIKGASLTNLYAGDYYGAHKALTRQNAGGMAELLSFFENRQLVFCMVESGGYLCGTTGYIKPVFYFPDAISQFAMAASGVMPLMIPFDDQQSYKL